MRKVESPKLSSRTGAKASVQKSKVPTGESSSEGFLSSARIAQLSRSELLQLIAKLPIEKLTNQQIGEFLSKLPDDRLEAICSFLIPLIRKSDSLERIIEVTEDSIEQVNLNEYGGSSFREHQWIKADVKRGKYLYARASLPGNSQGRQDKYLCKVPFLPGRIYKVPQISQTIRIEKFFIAPEQTWESVIETTSCFVSIEFLDDELRWLDTEQFPYPDCLDGYFKGCDFHEVSDMPSEPYCRMQIPPDLIARCELNFTTLASFSVDSWTLTNQDHELCLCFRDKSMLVLDSNTSEVRVEAEPRILLSGLENLLQKNSARGTRLNRQNASSLLERLRFSPKTSPEVTLYYLLTN